MAKKFGKRTSTLLLPPIPFDCLNFGTLSDRLDTRAIRHIAPISRNLRSDRLSEQVWFLLTLLRLDLGVYVRDAELSSVFHHTGSWAAGMTSDYKNALQHLSRTGPGRPNLVEPGLEHEFIQFCLPRQRERIPVTLSAVIDYLAQKSITADRWWVARFVECHEAEPTVQKASVLENLRHKAAANNAKRYFDIL
jgi:hypothetical protein